MSALQRALAAVVQRSSESELLRRPTLIRSRLLELEPSQPQLVEALVSAIECGTLSHLIDPQPWVPYADAREPAVGLLEASSGRSRRTAEWVVDAWGAALGLTDEIPAKPPVNEPETPGLPPREPLPPLPLDLEQPSPEPARSMPRREVFRRRSVLVGFAAGAALLLAGGTVAAVAAARPATFTTASHGRATTSSGTSVGSRIAVRQGPYELTLGSSRLRLSTGSTARITGGTELALVSGRAFVTAASSPITVTGPSTSATVRSGTALVSCSSTTCSVTSVDGTVEARTSGRPVSLASAEVLSEGRVSGLVPDAVRADPWYTANVALDRAEGQRVPAVPGPDLLGRWTMQLHRSDLPIPFQRTISFSTACTALGCTVHASTWASDAVTRSPISGTLRRDGDRLVVDYGAHGARCAWQPGTPQGGGVDGTETLSDTFMAQGSNAAARLTGTRTSRYTPRTDACRSPIFTAPIATTFDAARRAASPAVAQDDQQTALNYLGGTNLDCRSSAGAPPADRIADVECGLSGAVTSIELGVYPTTAAVESAYSAATEGLVKPDTGNCSTGPCEGVAPNGVGRMLLARTSNGALLVTYDPRAAHLLLVAEGPTTRQLATWWQEQQRSASSYSARPLPRVGV